MEGSAVLKLHKFTLLHNDGKRSLVKEGSFYPEFVYLSDILVIVFRD